MLKIAVMAMFLVGAVLVFFRPRLGGVLMWVVIWCYPNTLMYGTLPLNMRFDDLWVVLMTFVCLLFVPNRGRVGWVFVAAVLWMASNTLGNVTGLIMTGGTAWVAVVKDAIKALYIPLTVFVLCSLITDTRSLNFHLRGLAIAGALGSLLAVIMIYYPRETELFLIPRWDEGQNALDKVLAHGIGGRRAQGSLGVMTLGGILLNFIILTMVMTLYHPHKKTRWLMAGACVVAFVALGHNTTRGPIGAIGIVIVLLILGSSHRLKLLAWSLPAAMVAVFAFRGTVVRVLTRFGVMNVGEYSHESFGGGWQLRSSIFDAFLEHFSPVYLSFGMGMQTAQTMGTGGLGTTHNGYIGAFVYGGAFGVFVVVLVIVTAFKLGARLLRWTWDALSRGVGIAAVLCMIGMMIHAVVLENFQNIRIMQLFFAVMVLAERRLVMVQEASSAEPAEPFEQYYPAPACA